MKLWFMSVNRVTDVDFIRYGLQELASKGVEINVVDLSALMWGAEDYRTHNTLTFNMIFCNSLYEYKDVINSIGKNEVVLCGGVLSSYLHLILARKCKYIGVQTLGAIPHSAPIKNSKFLNLLSRFNTDKLASKIYKKVFNRFVFKFYPFYFVQRSGSLSSGLYSGIVSKTIILESQCYDIYQKLYQKKIEKTLSKYRSDLNGEYFLWIDQAIPFHTDTLKCNGDISRYAKDYFDRIQKLLRFFEVRYKVKVIVALHPRIIIDHRYTDMWIGWNTSTTNTIDLIEKAKFCITHNSTAIHAAVYFNKPLMVIKDKLLTDNGYDIGITDSFFYELDCNLIESDCVISELPELKFKINEEKYSNYINRYVSNTPAQYPINADVLYDFIYTLSSSKDLN
ncbi:hypothetical protein ACRN9J_19100 [Shewanella baltica]|uniref:hypothetical protein n=1 Tax=Shewanella baltica TaxID=62322 RepID=UPI003D793539